MRSKTNSIVFLLILFPIICIGQGYTYKEVKAKSEELLPKLIGTELASSCTYDTGTYYTYSKCPAYDTISCSITLQLNNKLELDIQPDLSVIPDFVIKMKVVIY